MDRSYFVFVGRALGEIVGSLASAPFVRGGEQPVVFGASGDDELRRWVEHASALKEFRPCPWARGPYAQTILGLAWARAPRVTWHREWLSVDESDGAIGASDDGDRGQLALDWNVADDDPACSPDAPLLFCAHGLDGSSDSTYMLRLAEACRTRGWRMVVYNRSGGRRTSYPRYAELGELRQAVEHAVLRRFPEARVAIGVGISAGSNALVKYAATHRGHPLTAVISVANAHSIRTHAQLLQSLPLADALLTDLARRVFRKAAVPPSRAANPDALRAWRTIRDFDAQVACPVHGYADIASYHDAMSCDTALAEVEVPMLSVGAIDDPLVPATQITYALIDAERSVKRHLLVVTARGGHVGYMTGWRGKRSWLVDLLTEYVAFIAGEQPDGNR